MASSDTTDNGAAQPIAATDTVEASASAMSGSETLQLAHDEEDSSESVGRALRPFLVRRREKDDDPFDRPPAEIRRSLRHTKATSNRTASLQATPREGATMRVGQLEQMSDTVRRLYAAHRRWEQKRKEAGHFRPWRKYRLWRGIRRFVRKAAELDQQRRHARLLKGSRDRIVLR